MSDILSKEEPVSEISHEELKLLLTWKGRTIDDWTKDDIQLGHLIRRRHYYPHQTLTEDDKALIARVILDRSKSEDTINSLSALHMWMPKKAQE